MPLVDSNLRATWDSLYNVYDVDAQGRIQGFIHFQRSAMTRIIGGTGGDADRLFNVLVGLGMTTQQNIALIGGAFGWVGERFIALGMPTAQVCIVDTSTWIQANKGSNATLQILNSDVNGSTGRRAIKQFFGSPNATVHWAISEDVLPTLSDAECSPFASSMRQLANNVVHWSSVLQPNADQDPRLNWKTLEQWKTLLPLDRHVQRGTSRVL